VSAIGERYFSSNISTFTGVTVCHKLQRKGEIKETDDKKMFFQIFYTLLVSIMAFMGADF